MARIHLKNASVEIPVFSSTSRSLTSKILKAASGGRLDSDAHGVTIVRALDKVSIELEDGDRLGVVGQNGAGKSTLLRVMSGVFVPTHGSAFVEGSIGSLIDVSLGINQEATGRENIFLRAALLGLSRSETAEKLEEIVEFSELGDFIDMPLRTYSSGMQMRLAFSVSTIVRTEILLMDEWLSVGDEAFNAKASERLTDLVEASKILVIASHSRALLEKVTNKVLWLEQGQVRLIGPSQEVLPLYFKTPKD